MLLRRSQRPGAVINQVFYLHKLTCSRFAPHTPQQKAKVDWGDVEAKAKREAMWLLEVRKQQVRELFIVPSTSLCSVSVHAVPLFA